MTPSLRTIALAGLGLFVASCAKPITITLSPATATLATGSHATFTATVSSGSVLWSVKEGDIGGTVTSSGEYTAPHAPGVFTLVATASADPTKTAQTLITVVSVMVAISPATLDLAPGATSAFMATVTGPNDKTVSWSVEPLGSGSVTAEGEYTAPTTVGTYAVVATSHADPTRTARAVITVHPSTVTITPAAATVDQGEVVALRATVANTTDNAVTWSVTEGAGTVSADGHFTAPAKAGTSTVTATSTADATQKISIVIFTRDVGVTLMPSAVSIGINETASFVASVTGTVNKAVTWSVTGTPLGSISTDGVFTAPAVATTNTVTATSAADPSKSASGGIVVTLNASPATALTYADPPGTGWRLVRNAAKSTAAHLVLDVVGPAGGSGRGLGLTLHTDATRVSWAKVDSGDAEYVSNQAFTLGSGAQLFKGLAQGAELKAGVFQKGTTAAASYDAGRLVSVALDLRTDAGTTRNTAITLTVTKAQALPATGAMTAITLATGVITAQ